jgi:hypothetical protein
VRLGSAAIDVWAGGSSAIKNIHWLVTAALSAAAGAIRQWMVGKTKRIWWQQNILAIGGERGVHLWNDLWVVYSNRGNKEEASSFYGQHILPSESLHYTRSEPRFDLTFVTVSSGFKKLSQRLCGVKWRCV